MTTAKHQNAMAAIANGTLEEKTYSIRFIKNSIIGNKSNKLLYQELGLVHW
jgi:hypothetical protein